MEQDNHTTTKRKWKQLSEKDRYKMEVLLEEGHSCAEIARNLGYSKRTIERERKAGLVTQRRRNPSNNKYAPEYIDEMVYKADYAQRRHNEKAELKGRALKIGHDHALADYIEDGIQRKLSPDAILGVIKRDNLQFDTTVCVKTVYNYLDNGIFRTVTSKDLTFKKGKKSKPKRDKKRRVALNNRGGKSIEDRPKNVDEREEMGHWELDLVLGNKNSRKVIVTMVERKSRRSLYALAADKSQKSVIAAIKRRIKREKGDFSSVFKTITTDNGSEFLDGTGIKNATGCKEIYYTHPYSAWEKGSNENGNRMLRRWFPKGTNFDKLTSKEIKRAEDWVNNYPRRMFDYKTANQMAMEFAA